MKVKFFRNIFIENILKDLEYSIKNKRTKLLNDCCRETNIRYKTNNIQLDNVAHGRLDVAKKNTGN